MKTEEEIMKRLNKLKGLLVLENSVINFAVFQRKIWLLEWILGGEDKWI